MLYLGGLFCYLICDLYPLEDSVLIPYLQDYPTEQPGIASISFFPTRGRL